VIPIVLYGYALHSSQASFIPMSALTPKADIDQRAPHVRFVPAAGIPTSSFPNQ